VNGLEAALQAGMTGGKDAYERNWCALQLAGLLLNERGDRGEIETILQQAVKNDRGRILVHEDDRELLPSISNRFSNRFPGQDRRPGDAS
jgi:hypothetical protein